MTAEDDQKNVSLLEAIMPAQQRNSPSPEQLRSRAQQLEQWAEALKEDAGYTSVLQALLSRIALALRSKARRQEFPDAKVRCDHCGKVLGTGPIVTWIKKKGVPQYCRECREKDDNYARE